VAILRGPLTKELAIYSTSFGALLKGDTDSVSTRFQKKLELKVLAPVYQTEVLVFRRISRIEADRLWRHDDADYQHPQMIRS